MKKLEFQAITHVGKIRGHNEDHHFVDSDRHIFIVADGMGGHDSGEVASELACKTIPEMLTEGVATVEAVQTAHQTIKNAPDNGIGSPGMGTTLVMAEFDDSGYTISWVGDSRAYLYSNSELSQLTKDHSYVQHLLDSGAISEKEAEEHPDKNIITQCLGSDSVKQIRVDQVKGKLYQGEQLLLCSDGLTGELSDNEIFSCLSQSKPIDTVAVDLIEGALENGGSDNITLILIQADKDAPVRPKRSTTRKLLAIADTKPTASSRRNIYAISLGVVIAVALCAFLFSFIGVENSTSQHQDVSISSRPIPNLPSQDSILTDVDQVQVETLFKEQATESRPQPDISSEVKLGDSQAEQSLEPEEIIVPTKVEATVLGSEVAGDNVILDNPTLQIEQETEQGYDDAAN